MHDWEWQLDEWIEYIEIEDTRAGWLSQDEKWERQDWDSSEPATPKEGVRIRPNLSPAFNKQATAGGASRLESKKKRERGEKGWSGNGWKCEKEAGNVEMNQHERNEI